MTESIPVTVLVQTKNEEVAILDCLKSLTAFDQIIVVDSNSTDATASLAAKQGVEVVRFTWNGSYPKKKQWQLDEVRTKHEWVLFIDADERPTPALVTEIRERLTGSHRARHVAYDIPLAYFFDGAELLHGHRVEKRALLRRTRVRFPALDDLDAPGMGELEGHYQPVADGSVGRMTNALVHDDPDPVRSWFDRHNRYSDWEAFLRVHPEKRLAVRALRSRQGRLFERIPGKALAFFLYAFVLKRGFLDGQAGLNYALALTFYYWQISLKVRELSRQDVAR